MLMNGIIYEEVGDIKNLTNTSNLPDDQDKELTDKLAKLIKVRDGFSLRARSYLVAICNSLEIA